MSPPQTSDTWLWLTLGVAAFVATRTIQYAMSDIVTLTAIDDQVSIPNPPTEPEPENSTPSFNPINISPAC